MTLGTARTLTSFALLVASQGLLTKSAQAEEPPAQPAPATRAPVDPHAAPVTPPDPAAAAKQDIAPAKAAERTVSLEPKISEAAPTGRMTFDIDPVADSGMIAVSLGFAGTLELINSTGEIRPQQIRPSGVGKLTLFSANILLVKQNGTEKKQPAQDILPFRNPDN